MAVQNERAVIDLVINGQQSKASLRDVAAAAVNARKELSRMVEADDPKAYAAKRKEVEALMRATTQMTVKVGDQITAMQKYRQQAGTILSGIVGGNVATVALEKLIALGPAVIDHQMKIRDQFSDIAKAADMTDAEVKDLNEQLKGLETRTLTEDLREIAVVGGQFGIAKDEMAEFVQAADMLNVALGDQFESVEKVAEVSLTLRNTFQDIKSERIDDDMLKIGNALNYLEAQGAATAPTMADFSSRIGGVAIPLGLTSGQVLGLSATLQELNVTSERGSTAVVDILNGIAKAPETFAKYARGVDGARLSSESFKNLVNTDLNAAVMAVIRGFKDGDTSATGMAAKLSDLDLKGNGVMEIFMKLVSNTDLLTNRQQQATEALGNTASVTDEFNKKNFELAVNLKKLGEWFDSFLENGFLTRFAEGVVSITVKLLGLSKQSAEATKQYDAQRTKVESLEKQMKPLIDRYDQLTKKSTLNRTEQQELKSVTEQIAKVMPQAVTQFDAYGRAIGISTDRAQEAIRVQRELLKSMNQAAVAEKQQELRTLEFERKRALETLRKGENVTVSASGNVTATPLSPQEVAKLQQSLVENQQRVNQTLNDMKQLEGLATTSDRRAARREAEGNKPKPKDSNFGTQETEAERKAREQKEKTGERARKKEAGQVKKHEDELASLIQDARQRTARFEENQFLNDQLQFGEHYAKMFALAAGNKDKMAQITELMYAELDSIEQKEAERQKKRAEKKQREKEEENKKLYEADLALIERKYNLALEQTAANGPVNPEEINPTAQKQLELEAEATFLQADLLLRQQHGQDVLEVNRKISENNQAQWALWKESARDTYQYIKDADQAWLMARQEAVGAGLGLLETFFKRSSAIGKAILIAEKAWAIASIVINLQKELSAIALETKLKAANAAAIPIVGPALAAAAYAAGATSSVSAKVRAGIGIATVAAQGVAQLAQKDEGGFTGVRDLYGSAEGFVDGPTRVNAGARSYIVGEKRKEWIMGGAMLENPVMADLANALQVIQATGAYRGLSYSAVATSGTGTASGGSSDALLMALLDETRRNNQIMEAYSKRPIMNNYRLQQEYDGYVQEIQTENSL